MRFHTGLGDAELRLHDTWLADDVLDATTAERLAHAAGAGNAFQLHHRIAGTEEPGRRV